MGPAGERRLWAHPINLLPRVLAIPLVALGLAVAVCLPPTNPYQRWQLLDGTIHANARWIYERINFDPTPIDVAIVGPSRTSQGVNAPRLAAALAARGLPANVVNFSLPESGRNINDVVVEQLLARKQPKLLILGVTEKPSRFGHSAFKFIAPTRLVVDPGYLGDANYLSDLVYLPFRQMRLIVADIAPGVAGLTKQFDPDRYRGHSLDTTGSIVLPDGRIKEGEAPAALPELMRGVRKLERGNHDPFLGRSLADLEFGDERHYVRRITTLARAHGVRVMFLFLPYYTGPDRVQERVLYQAFGPVLDAGFLATHADWYADYGHLTRAGAARLTDWMVAPVAAALTPRVGPKATA